MKIGTRVKVIKGRFKGEKGKIIKTPDGTYGNIIPNCVLLDSHSNGVFIYDDDLENQTSIRKGKHKKWRM